MDPRIIEKNVLKLRLIGLLKILLIPLIAAISILAIEMLIKLIGYLLKKHREKKIQRLRNENNLTTKK